MRDNWMSHPSYNSGDQTFEVSYKMLVDRLQYLPGNQIEGNQTVMLRAILGDDASTNLVTHIYLLGGEGSEANQNRELPGFTSILGIISIISTAIIVTGTRKE